MPYYSDQRHVLELTTIQREQLLPEDAIGSVDVRQGASVNLRDIVARGIMPSRYLLIDAAKALHLKPTADLSEYLRVTVGESVNTKTVLAEMPKQRNRRVIAPIDGVVA